MGDGWDCVTIQPSLSTNRIDDILAVIKKYVGYLLEIRERHQGFGGGKLSAIFLLDFESRIWELSVNQPQFSSFSPNTVETRNM